MPKQAVVRGGGSDDCGRQTEALKNGKRAKGILSHGNVS